MFDKCLAKKRKFAKEREVDNLSEFISWGNLGTLVGMVAAVNLIVQVTKNSFNTNPRWLSLIVAALVMAVYTVAAGDVTPEKCLIAVINVFVVVATATGTFEHIIKPVEDAAKD